ncbi:MAG: TonB-dependent siderophore receptor [Rhodocyclaceae bacterium]|nr:TonB-dependent siderophore receptor [Rhodocyclaceae bacterium]
MSRHASRAASAAEITVSHSTHPGFRPTLLVAAIHLTLAGGLLAVWQPEAQAQNAAPVAQQAPGMRDYDIPAGPLDAVLTHFVAESGVPLAATPALVQGRQSRGVRGTFSAQAALDTLLAGTGLEAVRNASGEYRLRAVALGAATLPVVAVTATALGGSALTEGTGSYTTEQVNVATKLPLSLRETPQTVTVITRQQMDDFGLTTMDEVLRSTSGVYASRVNGATNYTSRGFGLQVQYDGAPADAMGGFNVGEASPDTAFFDHVEIQQGAAGLLNGAGNPGGTINIVGKRPTEQFQAHVETQLGSWDKRRLVADVSTPLVQSGALRARVVALSDKAESFMDYVHSDKTAVYGVIEALPTDSTRIGIGYQHEENDNSGQEMGMPAAADGSSLGLSRSLLFGVPPYGFRNTESRRAFFYIEQQLGHGWDFKLNYAHHDGDVDQLLGEQAGRPDLVTGDGMSAAAWWNRRKTSSDSLDAHAAGPLHLLGRKHELAFGINGKKAESANASRFSSRFNFNLYDGPEAFPYVHLSDAPAFGNPSKTNQHGAYGVARLNLADPLKLILGTRISWYENINSQGIRIMDENAVVTPYAGIVYDINDNYSLYASYSDIFRPLSNLGRNGDVLKPVVGANYEAGVKGEFFAGRLNAAAAIFQLEETNRPAQDTQFGNSSGNVCGGWCYYSQGKIRSEGVELSLNGALSSNWQIGAGYTFVESEHANGANKGQPAETRIPRHAYRLFTNYHIPGTKWSVGGSLRAQSSTYRSGTGWRIEQKSYALVGLTAKYRISEQAEISAVVNNLFDKEYWDPLALNLNYIGVPRNFLVNLRYQF